MRRVKLSITFLGDGMGERVVAPPACSLPSEALKKCEWATAQGLPRGIGLKRRKVSPFITLCADNARKRTGKTHPGTAQSGQEQVLDLVSLVDFSRLGELTCDSVKPVLH